MDLLNGNIPDDTLLSDKLWYVGPEFREIIGQINNRRTDQHVDSDNNGGLWYLEESKDGGQKLLETLPSKRNS